MKRVAVFYSKYPHLAEQCRAHADGDSTPTFALMPKSRWLSIRKGQPVTDTSAPAPKIKGPGDHLREVIETRYGMMPSSLIASCGCKEMIGRMNKWGVAGCREHRADIIAHLVGQADQLPKGRRFVLSLPGGKWLAEREAGRMLDEALTRAE